MCLSHLIYTVRPCLIHTCHAAPMPSPTMPFFSTPRHSTAVETLLARVRLFPATTRNSTKLYQTHTNLRCRWPVWNQTPFAWTRKRVVAAHYKRDSVGLAVGYFRLPCGLSRRTRYYRSMAGARHGMCELTHGMAGERHGHGVLCANRS